MAIYQTTESIIERALQKAGEPLNGTSSYTTRMLNYLSDFQRALVAGGTLFDIAIDEVWPWARAERPVVLEVQPPVTTGTVSLTYGSISGTFSSGPAASVAGWFIRLTGTGETYRIGYHTAAATAFTLDTPFLGTTGTTLAFEAYKLDYEILSSYVYVGDKNKLDFAENSTPTQITATLNAGAYTLSGFATELKRALDDSAGVNTYTVTYSTLTRLFTISSSGATFQILGGQGTNRVTSGWPLAGFNYADYTGAVSYAGEIPFGSVSRIVEPIKFIAQADGGECLLEGVDPLTFSQQFTYASAQEGTPTYFTKIREDNSGKITIRLNNFPTEIGRLEIITLPTPIDLQNNTTSVPILPPKYYPLLEYAGCYFTLLEKEDTKKDEYLALAKAQLLAMKKHYSGEQFRTGRNFGFIAPRGTSSGPWYKRLTYGYDRDRN